MRFTLLVPGLNTMSFYRDGSIAKGIWEWMVGFKLHSRRKTDSGSYWVGGHEMASESRSTNEEER